MNQISPVLRRYEGGYMHWCPGCESMHMIAVEEPFENGARWTFDGNIDAPTFAPSINIRGRCHYFLRAGRLEFCGDCAHPLSGQVVTLPPLPAPLTG